MNTIKEERYLEIDEIINQSIRLITANKMAMQLSDSQVRDTILDTLTQSAIALQHLSGELSGIPNEHNLRQIARERGEKYNTFYQRVKRRVASGMPIDEAISRSPQSGLKLLAKDEL